MSLLCEFLLLECGRQGCDGAARCIRQFLLESLSQRKKVLSKQKKFGSIRKRQRDAARLAALPPVPVMKAAVRQAMIDIRLVTDHSLAVEHFPAKLHTAATAMMVGIIYLNGFAGRSKEWQLMRLDTVREAISAGRNFVVCTEHKTAAVYGDLIKYLAPGTMAAIQDYIDLPKGDSGKFLEPGFGSKSGAASVHTCLRRFCKVYMPEHEAVGVNLLRKWWHSTMKAEGNNAMKFVARLDAHSESIADKVYAVSTPEQDAHVAKHLVDVLLGGPVGPVGLTDTAMSCIDDVLARFGLAYEHDGASQKQSPSPRSPSGSGSSGTSSSSSTSSEASEVEGAGQASSSQPAIKKEVLLVASSQSGSGSSSSSSSSASSEPAEARQVSPSKPAIKQARHA